MADKSHMKRSNPSSEPSAIAASDPPKVSWTEDQSIAEEGDLTGLARTESTPLVMLLAILALAAAVFIGVAIEHPLTIPLAVIVSAALAVVLRAFIRRVRTPPNRRGAVTPPPPDEVFARLLAYSEEHPVLAVLGFILSGGGAAFEIGARAHSRDGGSWAFAAAFGTAGAVGGAIVGIFQVRRARRMR